MKELKRSVTNASYLREKTVLPSLRGTKQSMADRRLTLKDCRATARNDGEFGLNNGITVGEN